MVLVLKGSKVMTVKENILLLGSKIQLPLHDEL